jgi:hypothetical protein
MTRAEQYIERKQDYIGFQEEGDLPIILSQFAKTACEIAILEERLGAANDKMAGIPFSSKEESIQQQIIEELEEAIKAKEEQ